MAVDSSLPASSYTSIFIQEPLVLKGIIISELILLCLAVHPKARRLFHPILKHWSSPGQNRGLVQHHHEIVIVNDEVADVMKLILSKISPEFPH